MDHTLRRSATAELDALPAERQVVPQDGRAVAGRGDGGGQGGGEVMQDAVARSGEPIDEGAILRALVDLGTELEIDWPAVTRGGELRQAVREAVMVRRRAAE